MKTAPGLETDGTSFWLASYGTLNRNYIRRLTQGASTEATVNQTWLLPLTFNWPDDLAFVNGQLVYPQYAGPIRRFDPVTDATPEVVPSPSPYIYGLTFDGQSLLAGYGPGAGVIWRISSQDGSILDTWQTGTSGIWGLGFDLASQTLYIGAGNDVVVAVAPEPGAGSIAMLGGLILVLLRRAGTRSASHPHRAGRERANL